MEYEKFYYDGKELYVLSWGYPDLFEQSINKHGYIPKIKNVIFNDPATIVFWEDGTKTVVKACGDKFDPEKGLSMAITKKALGNRGNYYNEIRKWVDAYYFEQQKKDARTIADIIYEALCNRECVKHF